MTDFDALVARMDRLEAENRALHEEIGRLRHPEVSIPESVAAAAADPGVSRRQLLRSAGVGASAIAIGAVAATAATLAGSQVASASPAYVQVGPNPDFTIETTIQNTTNDENVLHASAHGTGIALIGEAASGIGVQGSGDDTGVDGYSSSGIGVNGFGFSDAGVRGQTDHGVGVVGVGNFGRGGRFSGNKAAIQLKATNANSHPSSGARGDLFVDKTGRLWFCKGGTTWVKLA